MSMKRTLLALLLSLPLLANAATVTHEAATADTGTTPNTSGAFTPATNDLLLVGVCATNTVDQGATATLTSSVGGFTFTLVDTFSYGATPIHTGYVFVSDALVSSATSQTVSFSATADEATGTNIMVAAIAGITRDGLDAIRQSALDEDNGSGQTPTTVFPGVALTGNPTLGFLCNTTNPATVTPPTNWTEQADIGHATPDHGGEYASRDSGFTGTTITWGSTFGSNGGAMSVEIDSSAAGTAVNFTSGPTVAAATNGYTISGTLNGSGFGALTAYAVAVAPADGAPTCAQIKAGQNDGGTPALIAANEVWTTDVADSFALTSANKPPSLDVHVCASDGTNDTSVTSLADQLRSADSGQEIVTIASISATGICDEDAYFDPDCAVGDVFEHDAATNEDAGCLVNIGTDGDVELQESGGSCGPERRTFEYCAEDVSSATDGEFTTPDCWAADDTAAVNNAVPVCTIEQASEILVLTEDAVMDARDLNTLGGCNDDDLDTLTFTVTVGTLPVGTVLSGTGNKDWTGTPTTENEAGTAITIQACDQFNDCDTYQFTVYVVNTWTTPNLVGRTTTQAADDIVTAAPWRVNEVGLTIGPLVCSTAANSGKVVSQSPSASSEISAFAAITVNLGTFCGTEAKIIFQLTDVTGLTKWTDYIPVSVDTGCVNPGTYENDGCWVVTPLASSTGLRAWVDYIPVFEVSQTLNKWRYENDGWIPVNTLTP